MVIGYWCLMPLFTMMKLLCSRHLYRWNTTEEKNTDGSQVTEKIDQIK